MEHHIVWVDIPVLDLDRAIVFYSKVLGFAVEKQNYNNMEFGLFPHSQSTVSACLVPTEPEKITGNGPLIYFNVSGRIDNAISEVVANEGKILEDKVDMGDHGFRVVILDSEGNRIALHSH